MNVFETAIEKPLAKSEIRVEHQFLFRLIYLWMGLGLIVTGAVATLVASSEPLRAVVENEVVFWVVLLVELGLVSVLSRNLPTMPMRRALCTFFVYAAVNGFTLSIVFLVFSPGAIVSAFATTAILFVVMTMIGFTTPIDLTRYSAYFLMGLVGLLLALIVNLVLDNSTVDFLVNVVGVVLFTALTAHDTQKIETLALHPQIRANSDHLARLSLLGAPTLYLDFINLFLFILNLVGDGDS